MAGQVVQITINVTDGNAAEAVQQVVAQLNAIGPAGEGAGAAAGAGLDKVGEHALSARENVRLLNDDLGLRIPRAMQAVIGQSQLLSGAIGMIGPGLIAMGAVDILTGVGEKVMQAYDKWVLMTGEIAAASDAVKLFGEMSSQALDQQRTAQEHYIQVTQGSKAADQFKANNVMNDAVDLSGIFNDEKWKKAPDEIKSGFQQIAGTSIAPSDLDTVIGRLQKYEDKQKEILATALMIQSNSGGLFQVSGSDLLKDQQRVDLGSSMIKGLTDKRDAIVATLNSIYADADKAKPGTSEDQEAAAKAKEKQSEILQLHNSARNSELQGIALLEAQREEALDSFKTKYGTSRAAIDAIDVEYNNKEIALWNQQWEEADKAMRTAQQAGLTGVAKIQADRANSLSDIDQKQKGGFDLDAAAELRKAANLKADNDILAAQKQFGEELDQIGMHSDDAQISGYARIADEAEKATKKIEEDWQKYSGQLPADSQLAVDAQLRASSTILDINGNMLREMEQLHQKSMDQIAKEEEQTARLSLAPWQQTALKIQDEWQDKVRAINEDEDRQLAHVKQNSEAAVMVEQEGNEKRTAAYQLMNAQMQQADEETRDKLASGLQSLFSNPAQFFEKRAMDTAFQMMANEMLSVFKGSGPTGGMLQYLFGMGPQMSTSTNPLTDIESALGMGGHGASAVTQTASPAMLSFQNGSTQLLTGSQALLSAATTLQSAAGSMSVGGGTAGMGSGGFGMLGSTGGSTTGGAGVSGLGGSSNVETQNPDLGGTLLSDGNFLSDPSTPLETEGYQLPGTLAADGSFKSAGGPNYGGAAMGMAGGALMGATSVYSAYTNSNPTAGAVGGAMGGMEAGAALGSIVPGLGTVVGGAIGAVAGGVTGLLAGIFGDQGRGQAEALDVGTIQPTLLKDMQDYEAGRSGYNSLASELNSVLISSKNSTASMGSGARSYYGSNIAPEINAALSSLQKQEIGGRGQVTLTAGQYHSGGMVDDFGDLATSDTEGFIHAMRNEFVVQPSMAQAHAPLLNAIQSNSVSYASSVQPRMPASSGSGAAVNLTIQAIDSKSVATWAKGGGGLALMAALNQAQRQYSGVGRG